MEMYAITVYQEWVHNGLRGPLLLQALAFFLQFVSNLHP
jgi:hypothetical protein